MSNNVSMKTLNILKAALPFVPAAMQRNLSYFVKVEEFNNMFSDFSDSIDSTISACEINDNGENSKFNPADLIYAIRPYLDKNEYETISMFINFSNAYNIYKSINNNPSSILSELLAGNNFNPNHNTNNTTNTNPDVVADIVPDNTVDNPEIDITYQNHNNRVYSNNYNNAPNANHYHSSSQSNEQINASIEALRSLLIPNKNSNP